MNCRNATALHRLIAEATPKEREALLHDWPVWARPDQLPPPGTWHTWLILGGRGAGKTRAGAEWVRGLALGRPPFADNAVGRIALVAETLGDAREVMVEGVSGLKAIHRADETPVFAPSRRRLEWPNGAIAQLFSAEDPESLRGPQFGAAWCDELAKWPNAEATYDMLQFGLRLGSRPRQCVTTTPRPIPLLKRLIAAQTSRVSRAATRANAGNLAPTFLEAIVARYGGTRLGRQELDGELIEDRPDALWSRAALDAARVRTRPPCRRIVVAIDPPASATETADACGIVAAATGEDGRYYVLEDATVARASPATWARQAVALYRRLEADRIVAEVNQGGDMVAAVLAQVDDTVPVETVRATRGKWLRAEPVAALYEQGRVAHCGAFPDLEDEMCDFGADGRADGHSPDRLDALVWALTALLRLDRHTPRIRTLRI